jgi:hypothetical protein
VNPAHRLHLTTCMDAGCVQTLPTGSRFALGAETQHVVALPPPLRCTSAAAHKVSNPYSFLLTGKPIAKGDAPTCCATPNACCCASWLEGTRPPWPLMGPGADSEAGSCVLVVMGGLPGPVRPAALGIERVWWMPAACCCCCWPVVELAGTRRAWRSCVRCCGKQQLCCVEVGNTGQVCWRQKASRCGCLLRCNQMAAVC